MTVHRSSTAREKPSRDRDSKVTGEHAAESDALRGIWDSEAGRNARAPDTSQGAFGEKWGIGNQAMVGFCLNGKIQIPLKAAIGFSRGLKVPIAAFSPRIAAIVAEAKGDEGVEAGPMPISALARSLAAALDFIENKALHRAAYFAALAAIAQEALK